MKPLQNVLFAGFMLLASIGAASAQTSDPSTSGGASTSGTTTMSGTTSSTTQSGTSVEGQSGQPAAQTEMKANAEAETKAEAETDASLKAIRDRAKSASPKARAAVEKRLTKISSDIDADANAKGKAVAAGRVAPEFGMTGDALVAEADQFGAGLGEVIIAHTLLANSKTTVTMDQLFSLRKDGMGWGQIAHGMNLRLGEVVSAVMSEGKVAQGMGKADGKVAMIHSGAASTHAGTHAGMGAGVHAGKTGAGAAGSVGTGVGVGAKVGK